MSSAKVYTVLSGGQFITTERPGAYAASRNTRVFGRLTCPSGKQKMKPANRVFLADWWDAVEQGFRPCKVCRPDRPLTGESLPMGHPASQRYHVALWSSNPRPYPTKPQCCFYAALHWETRGPGRGARTGHQVSLNEWTPYPQAARRAVIWAKKFGIPAIAFHGGTERVLWAPDGPATRVQCRALATVARRADGLSLTYPTMRP